MANATPNTSAPFAPAGAVQRDPYWLGQRLVTDNKITQSQLLEAMRTHRGRRGTIPFSETLEMLQYITPQRTAQLIAERARLPYIERVPVRKEFARRITQNKARTRCFLPFLAEKDTLHIAIADIDAYNGQHASADFPQFSKHAFHVAPRKEILASVEAMWSEAAIVDDPGKFIDKLLLEVIDLRASDVHFEPKAHMMQIRRRVDGALSLHANVGEQDRDGIIQALKNKAELDMSDTENPQGGTFMLKAGARKYRFRTSFVPVLHGEKAVLRISDDNKTEQAFKELGMSDAHIGQLGSLLDLPHGIILFTGPTGAGKSTLMFSAIAGLSLSEINVVSLEEPIEWEIPGINQVPIGKKLAPAEALRHVLRQDPDVIVVGELRDKEMASLAIRAALTGHLCLATLHTNDAVSAVTRLIDMGIEPFLVASAVKGVVAQRLVKKLCKCKRLSPLNASLKRQYGVTTGDFYEAIGCAHCAGKGYHERTGIFEVMNFLGSDRAEGNAQEAEPTGSVETGAARVHPKERIREIITGMTRKDCPSTEADLLAVMRECGATTLIEDGLQKITAGVTTLEELLRETAC